MNQLLYAKSDIKRSILFMVIALLLAIGWGLIGYYILSIAYYFASFFFYIAIFLLGMLFRVRNWLFIPFTYLLAYGSDLISRNIIADSPDMQQPLLTFLILYHIELIILSIMKINMDAKDNGWSTKQRWQNIGIALLLPSIALVVYYIAIRQVFVFE